MKKLLMAVAAVACMGGVAFAGPNAGGTLIVHTNPAVIYTTDVLNYCGQGGLQDCDQANSSTPFENVAVVHILAAFPDGSSPRVSSLSFGWSYDAAVVFLASGHCADLELATPAWPASGEGTALNWNVAQTVQLLDVYWMAGYTYTNPTSLVLGPHPGQGARFADDAVPSNIDDMALPLGRFGFGMPGENACPVTPIPRGACCVPGQLCFVATADECQAAGGVYQGNGTDCDPDPCPPPPAQGACCRGEVCTIETASGCDAVGGDYQGDGTDCDPNPCIVIVTGACCVNGECFDLTANDCAAQGGDYQGDGTSCATFECPTPTEESTWGKIKATYR